MCDFNCQLVKQNARYDVVPYRLLIGEKLIALIVKHGEAALPPLTLAKAAASKRDADTRASTQSSALLFFESVFFYCFFLSFPG